MCKDLRGTLLIVTADHGLTDSTDTYLEDFPEIARCPAHAPGLESRAMSLFVKREYLRDFAPLFAGRPGDGFLLMESGEAVRSGLFGSGTPHPRAAGFLGDFIAAATKETCLRYTSSGRTVPLPANHAGLTLEEMHVPLVVAGT